MQPFEVLLSRDDRTVHLADADAPVCGRTLCGKRWWLRPPVLDRQQLVLPQEWPRCMACWQRMTEQR